MLIHKASLGVFFLFLNKKRHCWERVTELLDKKEKNPVLTTDLKKLTELNYRLQLLYYSLYIMCVNVLTRDCDSASVNGCSHCH